MDESPGKGNAGFSLIELLLAMVIIGILAAIAIPNLLNAVHRGRQRRAMSDMRTLASAIEAYHVDNTAFPNAACMPGMYTDVGTTLDATSFTSISPTYIAIPPMRDGWGRFFVYNVSNGSSKYNLRCLGRNGSVDAAICGTTTDFNDDIIFSNGAFLQWPEGAQQ